VKRLQSCRRIGSVDKQWHLRRVTRIKVASEVRRNIQRRISATFAHFALQLLQVLNLAHHAKGLRINEAIDQLAALNGAIFVQNKHRHVFYVVVQRVTERDHLDQRRKKHEEKRHRIAPNDDEFLKQNCAEPAKEFVFHHAAFCCSAACLAESSTNTSSSEG